MLRSLKTAAVLFVLGLLAVAGLFDAPRVSARRTPASPEAATVATQTSCPEAQDPVLPLPSSFLPGGTVEFDRRAQRSAQVQHSFTACITAESLRELVFVSVRSERGSTNNDQER